MEARAHSLGVDPGTVLFPLRFQDGDHYPDEARARQSKDVSRWTSACDGFHGSAREWELEQQVKDWCKELAAKIARVPAWRPDFPVVLTTKPSTHAAFGVPRLAR